MKNGELEEKKDRGNTVTVGFSLSPTLYKITWHGGNDEYVRCGADILLNGLQADLEGEAQCPVCGKKTQLVLSGGKIDGLEPRDAILHVVEVPTKSGRIWIECESTHIFDKAICLQSWISTYQGKKGLVTSLEHYNNKIVERESASRQPPKYAPQPRGGGTVKWQ